MECLPCLRNINLGESTSASDPACVKDELREQIKLALPTALTQFSQYLLIVISLGFCGHLNSEMLDGAALAATLINVTGNSVMLGLSTACDTLFSQTFGSKNKLQVGTILQKSFLIMMLCCLPCWAVLINAEHILLLLGQNGNVSRFDGRYAMIYIGGLPGHAIATVLSKYLQCQSIALPSLVIYMSGNVFSACTHAILLFGLEMEIIGAGIAVTLTQWVIVLLHIAFIVCRKVYKATWDGWTRYCLNDWWMIASIAVPGLFMFCLDWWAFEILVFVVGLLGVVPLASHAIVYNMFTLSFMMPIGLSVAAGVRIGQHLGENNDIKAKTASKIAMCLAGFISLITSIIILVFRNMLPRMFTRDKAVLSMTSSLMPQLVLLALIECAQGTLCGVIRGIGQQKFGAIVNFVAHYCFNLPVAIPLLLLTNIGVAGAYWGIILGCFVQLASIFVRIINLDWKLECAKAQVRAGVTETDSLKVSEEGKENANQVNGNYLSIVRDVENGNTPDFVNVIKARIALLIAFLIILSAGIAIKIICDKRIKAHGEVESSTAFNKTI